MDPDTLILLSASDINRIIGADLESVRRVVEDAYRLHDRGQTTVSISQFLRPWPDRPSRFITLSAYVGGATPAVGSKFVASIPSNLARGLPRASALVNLCNAMTGRPEAVLEGSRINCLRTAASAAVGARAMVSEPPSSIGLMGCGPINLEIVRFLLDMWPGTRCFAYDTSPQSLDRLVESLGSGFPIELVDSPENVLRASLVSIATNAIAPTVPASFAFRPDQTVLHISLRDLTPTHMLAARNIVDDVNHVNREQTSVHLTAAEVGGVGFVAGSIGEVLNGRLSPRGDRGHPVIFSPFGLGALDVAVATLVLQRAKASSIGLSVGDFFTNTPVPSFTG